MILLNADVLGVIKEVHDPVGITTKAGKSVCEGNPWHDALQVGVSAMFILAVERRSYNEVSTLAEQMLEMQGLTHPKCLFNG